MPKVRTLPLMCVSIRPATAGWRPSRFVTPMAANAPSTPPERLSSTDSTRIIRTIRIFFQPIARKMPISRVRSATDMIMVFNTPTTPMIMAMAEVSQDIARMKRISVVFFTESTALFASIVFGPSASTARADSLHVGFVVGMVNHDGETGDLPVPPHDLLQILQQQHHHVALVADGLRMMPTMVYFPVSNSGILSPRCLSSEAANSSPRSTLCLSAGAR